MEVPKDLFVHLTYFIDDLKTWSELMLVSKAASEACEYRKEQKQWQFQELYVSGQYSKYGWDWRYTKISEEYPQEFVDNHRSAQGLARILLAGSVWGDGKYAVFKKPRLEILRKLRLSQI